jgi:hypothetical protein
MISFQRLLAECGIHEDKSTELRSFYAVESPFKISVGALQWPTLLSVCRPPLWRALRPQNLQR